MGAVRRLSSFAVVVLGLTLAAAPGSAQRRATSAVRKRGTSPGTAHVAGRPQTIYDSRLKVFWAANADLPANKTYGLSGINADGSMTYTTAQAWVRRLNKNHYLGHSNWTLPITPTPYRDKKCSGYNRKGGGNFGLGCTTAPLASLYKRVLGLRWPDTAVSIPDTTAGPFHDFQPYLYWTGVSAGNQQGFRTFSFNTGRPGSNQSDHFMYVLPVLPGNPFGGTATTGLQSVDSGQAVWEPGAGPSRAGITWLADANLAKTQTFKVKAQFGTDGSMQETTAVSWVQALNSNGWLGQHQGWSLPTPPELATLYTTLYNALGRPLQQQPVVPVPNTTLHGFQDIQPYLYWSCAGKSVQGPCHGKPNVHPQQWSFSFGNGYVGTDLKTNDLYVMVYYPAPTPKPLPGGRCPPQKPGQPITCV